MRKLLENQHALKRYYFCSTLSHCRVFLSVFIFRSEWMFGLTQISSSRKYTVMSTATNGNYFFFEVIWKSHTHTHSTQSKCVCVNERERRIHMRPSHFSCWHMWMSSSSCSFTNRMNDIPIELIHHCTEMEMITNDLYNAKRQVSYGNNLCHTAQLKQNKSKCKSLRFSLFFSSSFEPFIAKNSFHFFFFIFRPLSNECAFLWK